MFQGVVMQKRYRAETRPSVNTFLVFVIISAYASELNIIY